MIGRGTTDAPVPMMAARASAVVTATIIALYASAARAEPPVQVASSVEAGAVVPSTSTKHQFFSLELLVPLVRAAGTKLLAGAGARALTRDLPTSSLPSLVALGAAGSLRLEF